MVKHYLSDKPCLHGHRLRYVKSNDCVECAKARDVKRRAAKPEQRRSERAQWYASNSEKDRMRSMQWRAENAAAFKECVTAYHAAHPELLRSINAKRRAKLLKAAPSWLTAEQLEEIRKIYAVAEQRTARTGIHHHVDHVVPLQGKNVSGLHVPWNLQVIPAAENLRKRNKF